MKTLLIVCALLGLGLAYEDKTIVQYLADTQNYTVLSKLITDAGLASALSTTGPYTILAPTDLAFSKLSFNVMTSLKNDLAHLKTVLEYHVIQGFILVPQIKGTVTKTTLNGENVTITEGSSTQPYKFDQNANLILPGDVVCNNGVVQPIDEVLIPKVIDHVLSIAQVLLQRDDSFNDLFLALLLGNLTDILRSGDFTLFAPVDTAFAVYSNNLLRPGGPNAKYIYQEVLKYHIVPGGRMSALLKSGSVYTLHGTAVNITKTATGIMVNQAHVIEADISAANGVIHAIDSLLIPGEFLAAAGASG